jgi:hypothetical protein
MSCSHFVEVLMDADTPHFANGDLGQGTWIGDVRTQKEITAKIEGSRLSEEFHQPAGAVIRLVWQRVD